MINTLNDVKKILYSIFGNRKQAIPVARMHKGQHHMADFDLCFDGKQIVSLFPYNCKHLSQKEQAVIKTMGQIVDKIDSHTFDGTTFASLLFLELVTKLNEGDITKENFDDFIKFFNDCTKQTADNEGDWKNYVRTVLGYSDYAEALVKGLEHHGIDSIQKLRETSITLDYNRRNSDFQAQNSFDISKSAFAELDVMLNDKFENEKTRACKFFIPDNINNPSEHSLKTLSDNIAKTLNENETAILFLTRYHDSEINPDLNEKVSITQVTPMQYFKIFHYLNFVKSEVGNYLVSTETINVRKSFGSIQLFLKRDKGSLKKYNENIELLKSSIARAREQGVPSQELNEVLNFIRSDTGIKIKCTVISPAKKNLILSQLNDFVGNKDITFNLIDGGFKWLLNAQQEISNPVYDVVLDIYKKSKITIDNSATPKDSKESFISVLNAVKEAILQHQNTDWSTILYNENVAGIGGI